MNWADVIVPIGGDGTFLLAAGRASPLFAQSHTKIPIVGFNSDPQRSAGRLLLPKHYSDYPGEAVAKIKGVRRMKQTYIQNSLFKTFQFNFLGRFQMDASNTYTQYNTGNQW